MGTVDAIMALILFCGNGPDKCPRVSILQPNPSTYVIIGCNKEPVTEGFDYWEWVGYHCHNKDCSHYHKIIATRTNCRGA